MRNHISDRETPAFLAIADTADASIIHYIRVQDIERWQSDHLDGSEALPGDIQIVVAGGVTLTCAVNIEELTDALGVLLVPPGAVSGMLNLPSDAVIAAEA